MAIDVAAQIRYWREGSTDDLEAANALLDARKVRQAGFFLHLAVEKAIKACVTAMTSDLPPRSHDLLFLIEKTGITVDPSHRDFLARAQVYCLEGRYPAEMPPVAPLSAVRQDLQEAAEIIEWLMNQLSKL